MGSITTDDILRADDLFATLTFLIVLTLLFTTWSASVFLLFILRKWSSYEKALLCGNCNKQTDLLTTRCRSE